VREDRDKDQLHVRYDASKVTPQDMIRTIEKMGVDLTGKVVSSP
jgi:hypothetical protein